MCLKFIHFVHVQYRPWELQLKLILRRLEIAITVQAMEIAITVQAMEIAITVQATGIAIATYTVALRNCNCRTV